MGSFFRRFDTQLLAHGPPSLKNVGERPSTTQAGVQFSDRIGFLQSERSYLRDTLIRFPNITDQIVDLPDLCFDQWLV